MHQTINAGSIFYIDPGEEPNTLKFFYILEGMVVWETENREVVLKTGDYFYVNNLNETTVLKTISKVTMLYVANQPVFHLLSNEILKFEEMRQKVETKDMYTFEYIKKHPSDGSDFIKTTFLKESALAILQHHERSNGSGYPNSLKSHEICYRKV